MKPRFRIGQRVCVVRATAGWDAPIGTCGTVASYTGPNDRGTDWEVGILRDGSEAFEPAWLIDESCLGPAGPGAFDPLPFESLCCAADGAFMDTIITRVDVDDPPDRNTRCASAVAVLAPLLGGTPLRTHYSYHSWYACAKGPGDVLTLFTIWCACRQWTKIVASLRQRFPESNWVVDDGWALEIHLPRGAAQEVLGPDAVKFRLTVEPWSSFERRPAGAQYGLGPPAA